jgi:hypothetical protein
LIVITFKGLIMQNKFLALCAVAALFAQPGLAQAQVGNGGATYSDVNGKNQWADFMPKFVEASGESIAAQARLLYAVGMSDQANALAVQAKEMSRLATPGMVEQLMASRKNVSTALMSKMAAGGMNLLPGARVDFAEGIDALARSIKLYEAMSTDLPGVKATLRGAGEKARTGLFVAKALPGYVGEAKQELAAAVAFARANAITVGADAAAIVAP